MVHIKKKKKFPHNPILIYNVWLGYFICKMAYNEIVVLLRTSKINCEIRNQCLVLPFYYYLKWLNIVTEPSQLPFAVSKML